MIPGEPMALQKRLLVMDCKIKERKSIVRQRPLQINWWEIKEKERDGMDCKAIQSYWQNKKTWKFDMGGDIPENNWSSK